MAAPSTQIRGPGVRTGSTSGAQIVGLLPLRRELKKLEDGKVWTTELSRGMRTVARKAEGHAQSAARGGGGSAKHFAGAIKGRGGVTGARLMIADSNANATFWGAKQQWTGWNAPNAGKGKPNQPDWVGNSWDVASLTQGPYFLNASLATHMPEYIDDIWGVIGDITHAAFPDAA